MPPEEPQPAAEPAQELSPDPWDALEAVKDAYLALPLRRRAAFDDWLLSGPVVAVPEEQQPRSRRRDTAADLPGEDFRGPLLRAVLLGRASPHRRLLRQAPEGPVTKVP